MTTEVTIDRGRIRMPGVLVYLERAVAPATPLSPGVIPRPHGVAPAVMMPTAKVVASVAVEEIVWLGFQPIDRDRPVTVRVRLDDPQPRDAVNGERWVTQLTGSPPNYLVVPPETRLVGVPGPDGLHLLSAPRRLTVLVMDPPAHVAVRLVRPAVFARLFGRDAEPLDPRSAYTEWRAP